MNPSQIIIFSDGACLGNPGPGGYGAILAENEHVSEIGGFEPATTNNRMEMTAALKALQVIQQPELEINLYTDSQYLINGITKWIHGWIKKDWLGGEGAEVANRDIWEALYTTIKSRKLKINWHYVRGHVGTPANERVDQIATSYAAHKNIELYSGAFSDYPISLDAKTETLKPFSSQKKESKALGYLSLVGGQLLRHKTWPECEARVKGASGARFKKFFSEEEAKEIIKNWEIKS